MTKYDYAIKLPVHWARIKKRKYLRFERFIMYHSDECLKEPVIFTYPYYVYKMKGMTMLSIVRLYLRKRFF